MINRVSVGQIQQSNQAAPQRGTSSERSFMDALREQFDNVTSRMQDVPGMPGIYSINQEQTLASLDITDVSGQTTVSSLI